MLSLAISPCPNDTFIFCEMVPRYRLELDDVESLNLRAERGEFDVTKISVAAYGRIRDQYALLRAGGAPDLPPPRNFHAALPDWLVADEEGHVDATQLAARVAGLWRDR